MHKVEENMFNENTKLVNYTLKKYFNNGAGYENNGITREDLYQIGCIGLLKSIPKFDEKLCYKFSTYAITYISGEIKKELTDKLILIKYPRHIKRIARMFNKEDEEKTTTEEIMLKFDVSEDDAKLIIECIHTSQVSSLDVAYNDNSETTLADVIASNYSLENSILKEIELHQRLAILTEKERTIITLSLESSSQSEIGKKLGITQVQVSRIIKKSILKINEHFSKDENMEGALY
jgi:RNA polymerase sporulation-specific sigma factor